MGVNYRHWYRMPWHKHVLSLRGRLETVDAYSGDLPIYERLFLGGPRTVRGVEYRDIGPKVYRGGGSKTHAPLGGQTLAQGTVEYTIPVFKAVRFATFMDVGSLGEDAFDPELSDVCVAVGIGLRIDIPDSRSVLTWPSRWLKMTIIRMKSSSHSRSGLNNGI